LDVNTLAQDKLFSLDLFGNIPNYFVDAKRFFTALIHLFPYIIPTLLRLLVKGFDNKVCKKRARSTSTLIVTWCHLGLQVTESFPKGKVRGNMTNHGPTLCTEIWPKNHSALEKILSFYEFTKRFGMKKRISKTR